MIEELSFSLKQVNQSRPSGNRIHLKRGLHVIYGPSGTGKSEIARALAGMNTESPVFWDLTLFNRNISSQMVMQNPDMQILFPTVGEELTFNLECAETNSGIIQERYKKLQNIPVRMPDHSRHPVTLSGGEKEVLNLVTAISTGPELLVIDDGLSFLNKGLKHDLVDYISNQALKTTGIVVWFTSDIEDSGYSDYSWILGDSGLIQFDIPDQILYPERVVPEGKMKIRIKELNFGYPGHHTIFKDFTFAGHGIRSLGIIGKNGSGKSTLARLLTGALEPESGDIQVGIEGFRNPRVGYLDQFPEKIIGTKNSDEFLELLITHGLFNRDKMKDLVNILSDFNINWDAVKNIPAVDLPWTTIRLLTGFMTLYGTYDLLILDEPTFGLGWEQKVDLSEHYIEFLKKSHLILISHDYDFIKNICNLTCLVESN